MFTGIVQHVGVVKRVRPLSDNSIQIDIDCKDLNSTSQLGQSISIDGICLRGVVGVPHMGDVGSGLDGGIVKAQEEDIIGGLLVPVLDDVEQVVFKLLPGGAVCLLC